MHLKIQPSAFTHECNLGPTDGLKFDVTVTELETGYVAAIGGGSRFVLVRGPLPWRVQIAEVDREPVNESFGSGPVGHLAALVPRERGT